MFIRWLVQAYMMLFVLFQECFSLHFAEWDVQSRFLVGACLGCSSIWRCTSENKSGAENCFRTSRHWKEICWEITSGWSGILFHNVYLMKTFVCRGCVNPVTSTGCTSVDIGVNAHLELVDKFCYLGNMLSVDGDTDAAVETRIQIGWNKFRQLVRLLTNRDISLIVRGRLYSSCVQSSMYDKGWLMTTICEWVNVSSVPAYPGCPAQNPESRKTCGVCVCVCVCVCQLQFFR